MANALHQEHVKALNMFYIDLRFSVLKLTEINFQTIKETLSEENAALVHNWLGKDDDPSEFYGVLFGIILDSFVKETSQLKLIDIQILYFLYGTLPSIPNVKIHINHETLKVLIDYITYLQKNRDTETLEIIELMLLSKWIVVGFKQGMRTVILNNNGSIAKETEASNLDTVYKLEKVNFEANEFSRDKRLALVECLEDYLKEKNEYVTEVVKKDPNEPLNFDNYSEKLMKEGEIKLGALSSAKVEDLQSELMSIKRVKTSINLVKSLK